MIRDEAHFVECQPLSAENFGEYGTPPAPGTILRPEAYINLNTDKMFWYDRDWNYLYNSDVPNNGNSACAIDQLDDATETVVSFSSNTGHCIAKIDQNLNVDGTYYRDPNWGTTTVDCQGLMYSSDEQFLYSTSEAKNKIYKFEVATGNLVWAKAGYQDARMTLDADDNIYTYERSGGWQIRKYDSDGNLLQISGQLSSCSQIYYDSVSDRILACGSGLNYAGAPPKAIVVVNKDTLAMDNYYEVPYRDSINTILRLGDYYYCTGDVNNESLIILDTNLNYVDGIATQSPVGVNYRGLILDWDGNLACQTIHWSDTNVYIHDTDLNYITTHTYPGDGNLVYSPDQSRIPNVTSSTPGTSGSNKTWHYGGIIYGFEHLIGETLQLFIDGVVYPSQVVSDDGTITLPVDVTADSEIHIGLQYCSKLRPMKPLSHKDMMKRRATCKQMGISFHNTDNTIGRSEDITDTGVRYGVHDDDMKQIDITDPQWKNKCDIDGLFTGSVAVRVPDGFSINMPLQVEMCSPLPCIVRSMIPKVDVTGT